MNQGQVRQVYFTFSLVSIAAFVWLLWNFFLPQQHVFACPFHTLTGIGCPSCGITRSVLSIAGMDLAAAWNFNPLGFPVFLMLLVIPVLLFKDLLKREMIFYRYYIGMEVFLKKHRVISALLILIVFVNWMLLVFKEG